MSVPRVPNLFGSRRARRRARPRGLRFFSVGAPGERYPAALTAHKASSGVYVIRDASTRQVLYVGESHAGRLYGTVTRHFQWWSRSKTFWRGAYGTDHDPGVVYARSDVEVALLPMPAGRAIDAQNRLIRRLRPRDNLVAPPVDDVPF